MKKIKKLPLIILVVILFTSCSYINNRNGKYPTFTIHINNLKANKTTTKYGQLKTNIWAPVFYSMGYEPGDIVKVSFMDQQLDMPVVTSYEQFGVGDSAVVSRDGNLLLSINMGDFLSTYGIADLTVNADKTWSWIERSDSVLPLTVKISMAEKAGYLDEYRLLNIKRTNNRNDYKHLTDEEFANFRKINTSNMGNVYRTSNPVNTELGRNKYADEAIKSAGVTVILNLSDKKEDAESRDEYKNSYYSTCNVKYLNLGVDVKSDEFRKGLAEGLKFFASNKGVYAIHCTEGKDRAGFVSALLECLLGASVQEVAEDYMITYYNYYGVEKGTDQYNKILTTNIVKTIESAFQINDFWTDNLQKAAEKYMLNIGLTSTEIKELKSNLSKHAE